MNQEPGARGSNLCARQSFRDLGAEAEPTLELRAFLAQNIDQRGVADPFGNLQRRSTAVLELRMIDPVLLHQAHAIDIGTEHGSSANGTEDSPTATSGRAPRANRRRAAAKF